MNNVCKHLTLFLASCLLSEATLANDSVTTRLKDTVKKGEGDIDLQVAQGNKAISAQQIEAYRNANNGVLVLGVDINEAASGSEKASTQGVAVESVTLTAIIDGVAIQYTEFYTETKSSIAAKGQNQRQFYYTLLGRTGSNSITGSELDGTSFDSTLSIPVSDDLSQASSLKVQIRFLETNESLGDPEAFYDFSAGFEDLALLAPEDAQFLDQQAAGRDEAPLVVLTDEQTTVMSRLYYPSSSAYYIVGYEDQYPNLGDYDFNDLVVGYRVIFGLNESMQVMTISGEGYLIARGGSYDHNWHLRIDLPQNAQAGGTYQLYIPDGASTGSEAVRNVDTSNGIDVLVYDNTSTLFAHSTSVFANTEWDSEKVLGHKFSFEITLDTPIPVAQMPSAPFDPYLFVVDTNYEIHLQGEVPVLPQSSNIEDGLTSFVDDNGYPFALIFPEDWRFPNEYVDIGEAYPQLLEYINSNKQQNKDWYKHGVEGGLSKHTKDKWAW